MFAASTLQRLSAHRHITSRRTLPFLRLVRSPTLSPSLPLRRSYATPTPPTMSDPAYKDYGSFKLLQSVDVKYAPVNVSKWRSDKTGLTVTLGNHSSPLTNGYFVIASEIFDDTGRPHTLEHLVFLGSKKYPYKGVLDNLANRAGSNGTNAWTANDHTAYTITTAGSKGFLNVLPVFVDHILHATMTDAGFVTEVHHVNGKGEDAGVVYSEMQARENQSYDRMALALQRMLYPTTSAYRSETGGLLQNLRVLTAQQIRDYHAKYYVPHNLNLHMDGAVNVAELFDVLNNVVEPMILENKKTAAANGTVTPPEWKRPFVETTTAEPFEVKTQSKVVEFMEEDESMGEIQIVYLGPSPTDELNTTAINILASYLTFSSTAPLNKEFVEIAEPLATHVGIYAEARVNRSELSVSLSDVPAAHLDELPGLFQKKMAKIVSDEGIDMQRMKNIIKRKKRNMLEKMEKSASDVIAGYVIQDFLYGDKDGKELPVAFDKLGTFETLDAWTADQWLSLIDKYFISGPSLTAIGKPSAKLAHEIEEAEKKHVADQCAKLGEEGLKKAQREVDAAKEESETPIPPEMLTSFPAVDPSEITWIPVETAVNPAKGDHSKSDNGAVQRKVDSDGAPLPYHAHFASVKSNFVTISVLFDTINLPDHLRPYMALLQSALFDTGVRRADGTTLTHEEVVDKLNEITVFQDSEFQFQHCFSETYTIAMRVEKEQYAEALAWLRDILTGSIFSKERLEVLVAKELQNLPSQKRDGNTVARAWANKLLYDGVKATSEAASLLHQLEFIPRVSELLKENPEKVQKDLEDVMAHLVDPSVMRVSVSGDIAALPEPRTTLAKHFLPLKDAVELQPLSTAASTLTPLGQNPSKTCVVIPMGAIEGSYSVHWARGPEGWDHPDAPALRLASAVLNAMESYLWKSIRGAGLAYGANVELDVESGHVGFSLYRSPNALKAFEEGGKVMRSLADGSLALDTNVVDGARSSMVYSYARKAATVGSAAESAYLDEVLKGVGKDFSQRMLREIPKVTLDDLRRVIGQYFVPIFDPATSVGSVSVNAGKADEVVAGFTALGFAVERHELPSLGAEDVEMDGSESGSESGSDGSDAMEDVRSP